MRSIRLSRAASPSLAATFAILALLAIAHPVSAGQPHKLPPPHSLPITLDDVTTLTMATSPQAPLPPPAPDPKAPAKVAGKEACFAVDTITVTGLSLIDREAAQTALKPFSHPCQGNETIKGLLVTLNALHADKGYVTTQAYLPKQDIKATHTVKIDIKVGRIADVVYEERPEWAVGSYLDRLNTKLAAVFTADTVDAFFNNLDAFVDTIDDPLERPLIADPRARTAGAVVIERGDVLELEAMQQGLDQMNKAGSSKAKAKLDPGPDPATSIVKIVNAPQDAFRLVVGLRHIRHQDDGHLALPGRDGTRQLDRHQRHMARLAHEFQRHERGHRRVLRALSVDQRRCRSEILRGAHTVERHR